MSAPTLDPWLAERLACPRDHGLLTPPGCELVCGEGHRYPCVDGIPAMIVDDVRQTPEPQLVGIRAAKRVADQLGIDALRVVGDARFRPFRSGAFDVEFSYSVLQHLAKDDVRTALAETRRSLAPGGRSIVQMPTFWGLRNLMHQARRGFAEPTEFLVRYCGICELRRTFAAAIGPTTLSVDGFFSPNAQKAGIDLLPRRFRAVVRASEAMRWITDWLPPLITVADSVYVESVASP